MIRLCSENQCSKCSGSVQTFRTMFKMFRICSDTAQNIQTLFSQCSECSESVQNFQSMFRMLRIFSQCSEYVQTFSEFLAPKLVYSEFVDFVVMTTY